MDVAAPVLAALRTLQQEFAEAKADVRWARAEGMHVTLKFLGAMEAPPLEHVHSTLVGALKRRPALQLQAHGLGAFPSLRRPRVLWVGVHGDGLVELAGGVDDALTPLGFAKEKRDFTAHLTLGRINSPRGWPRLEEVFKAHLDDDFGTSDVDAVTIYRSTLQRGGAVYTPLWTIPLNQHTGQHTGRSIS